MDATKNTLPRRLRRAIAKKNRSKKLATLLSAALTIPSLATAQTAPPTESSFRLQYGYYQDFQPANQNRMRIRTPSISINTPIGDSIEFDGSFVLDSISGASPYYHSSLSGASGIGIKDTRRETDLKLTKYFDRFAVGARGVFSNEDDYISRTASVDSRFWTEDRNTVFAFAVGFSNDDIYSTIAPDFHDRRRSAEYLVGVTQTLSTNDLIQSNITYSSTDGFLTDPYKTYDNRPRSRELWAWLTRYRHFLSKEHGSLHLDYRFTADSWNIKSHMLESAWYVPVTDSLTIAPLIRYYTQSAAFFYSDIYPPSTFDSFYSADQRTAAFAGITTGIKAIYKLGGGWSIDGRFDYLQQHPDLRLGGGGSDSIKPFFAKIFVVGLSKKF